MARGKGLNINGWLVLDKPQGMTSTHAVGQVKWMFQAKKAGHAGTLDPLATGILPIAFGEATKTVPYVVGGKKAYRFTVRWGDERNTDDSEGVTINQSASRPKRAAIEASAEQFVGDILQTPPQFSAIKIDGERAYDLAREGTTVMLEPRPVFIERLSLVDMPDGDTTVFEAECGKGTYVRSLARDMGRLLGCYGHVIQLRRTRVGPFCEADAFALSQVGERAGAADAREQLAAILRPVAAGLEDLPFLRVNTSDAGRLKRGQSIILRGRDAPVMSGEVCALSHGEVVALGEVIDGEFRPTRVFNLG